jgi:ketosteroid isomerase-like protein
MAQENVEVVRQLIDAWNENDWSVAEQLYDDNAVVIIPDDFPDGGTALGWGEVRRYFERLKESWTEDRIEATTIDAVGDRVIVRSRWSVTGATSGVRTELRITSVWWLNNRRVIRLELFLDDDKALEAVGLRK